MSRTLTAWFVVCVKQERPDGPGVIIGPFPDREMAAKEAEGGCGANHLVVHGPGSPAATLGVARYYADATDYWIAHPDEVPPACTRMVAETTNPVARWLA